MSRYERLAKYLDKRADGVWEAKFADVEHVLGFRLPASAYRYPAWWANQRGPGHSQTRGWRDAGWRTCDLDLTGKSVRFERQDAGAQYGDDLWTKAHAVTGIADREQLMIEGLKALVARDAAARLASLGGTMPDLAIPERERPTA